MLQYLNIRKGLEYAGFLLVLSALILFGLLQGVSSSGVSFQLLGISIRAVFIDAVAATVMFSVFLSLSGISFLYEILNRNKDIPQKIEEGEEKLTVIVPVYRDSEVLERAAENILESNYNPLEVLIVHEPDDKPCKKVAEELSERLDKVNCLVNESDENSKAGAINFAFDKTESGYIGLVDADQTLHPDFIPNCVAKLQEKEVVQGRRVPIPEGVIESLSYYEKVMFRISGQILKVLGFNMMLSSSTVMRREVLEELDGYDHSKVTEDLDFGHRCYKESVNTGRADRYPTYMEAPHNLKDLWGQKKRWMLGQVQILHHKLSEIARGSLRPRLLVSTAVVSMTVIGNLLMLTLIPKFLLLILLGLSTAAIYPLLILTGAGLAARTFDFLRGTVSNVGYTWLLIVLTYPIYSLIMTKSVLEYLISWSGEWYRVQEKG